MFRKDLKTFSKILLMVIIADALVFIFIAFVLQVGYGASIPPTARGVRG